MSENIKTPHDHRQSASADAPPPEQNSEVPGPAPTGGIDAPAASAEGAPPAEPGIEKNADSQASPAPEAETQPKRSKSTKAETGKDKTGKTKAQPKTDRAKGTGKRAAGNPGAGGDATAADEGAPIMTYLHGTRIEPAMSPPAGTLPPQLGPLFPDMLSIAAVLAVTAAAAGHGVQFDVNKNGEGNSLALRVAVVGEDRHLPQAVMPVLQAAYALEQEDVRRWSAEKQKSDLLGTADAARRRAYQQMLTHAGMLGLADVSDHLDLPTVSTSAVAPRPRLVLRDPGQKDVTRALEAADTGILLVDGRRMPTMAGFGVNYDMLTANLLNAAAAGHPLELADPRLAYCIRMRPVAVSVIGTQTIVDTCGVYKAKPAMLEATVFVPIEENSKSAPTGDAVIVLTEILQRVRALTTNARDTGAPLRLSAPARKILEQAKTRLAHASTGVLRPLADYYAAAGDLVRRIAVGLHVLDHAARKADRLSAEVGKDAVQRAVTFVEQCALPAARSALTAASVAPEVRNGRRILSYAQLYASVEHPQLVPWDVGRILRRTMTAAEFDCAIRRLVADELLTPSDPDEAGGGHAVRVVEEVFLADNRLPDLVTDPRRPRQ